MTERHAPLRTGPPPPRRARAGALLVAFALGAAAPSARAQQDPSAAEISAARGLFLEGLKLAEAGRCADALERFERAERLHHAVTILARLGECQIEVGKVVQGTETLLRVAREPLPPNAPRAFVLAQARAQKVLDVALPKVAKLKISLKNAPDAGASVALDGEAVPGALLDTFRPTDPGAHAIEATAPGYLKETARVTLAEGDSQALVLTLRPDPSAPKPAPPEAPAPAAAPGEGRLGGAASASGGDAAASRLPAYVAFGVGAVGLAAGATFGLVAMNKRSGLDDVCRRRGDCPADAREDIDAMQRSATLSTVGFGVAVAGAGAGVALLLLAGKPAPAAAAATAVRPWVGVGSLGLSGSF